MDALRKPPFSFDIVIKQKELLPRDPSLVYYPLVYIRGRSLPPFDKADLDALRQQVDPGEGTLFADGVSPEFDAGFRRFVKDLLPTRDFIPIPHDDELFTATVGADLSKVEFNKAAGGRRGFPDLEGVWIDGRWAIIYSRFDIGGALDANANIEAKGYTPESSRQIASNVVIYSTLPGPLDMGANAAAAPEAGSEQFVLENGLTVLLRPIRGSTGIALNVLYSIGSDHDPVGRSGLTHMVEHLYVTAAAGQAKARTAEDFAGRYALGANAQTGHRYTVFATVFPKNELDAELKDAAARMGDLRIAPKDLERERSRILEEVGNMFGAIPMLGALNNARELVRPTPGGGRAGGSPEHLRALMLADVLTYWQRYYKPTNAILSVAGDIDPVSLRKSIEATFAGISPGERMPPAHVPEKAKFGAQRELTVDSLEPDARPVACLAYAAPQPRSDLYAPFLVLTSRLWAASAKFGNDGPTGSPVYFTPLDDGSVVAISSEAMPGETGAQAFARIEAIVAETLKPNLRPFEIAATRQQFAPFTFPANIPENVLSNNIYGVAFALARRQQLRINPARLDKALGAVTEQDIRRAVTEIFGPSKHAGAFVAVRK